MYLEKKKIADEIYNYLKLSVRYKDKIRTKTVAYLGKGILTKEELKKAIAKYSPIAEEKKNEAIEELKFELEKKDEFFLTKEQLQKIEEIRDKFNKKLKELDEKTKKDNFKKYIIVIPKIEIFIYL